MPWTGKSFQKAKTAGLWITSKTSIQETGVNGNGGSAGSKSEPTSLDLYSGPEFGRFREWMNLSRSHEQST